MQTISLFSLEQHSGDYQQWPLKTVLIMDGQPTALAVPGYRILHQFQLETGDYLLITDWDCPFEEATEFLLMSKSLKILSRKKLGAPYVSFLLDKVEVLSDSQLKVTIFEADHFLLSINPPSLLKRSLQLSLKRV